MDVRTEINPEDLEKRSVWRRTNFTHVGRSPRMERRAASRGLSVLIRWDNPSIQLSAVFRLRPRGRFITTSEASFTAAILGVLVKYVSVGATAGRGPLFQLGATTSEGVETSRAARYHVFILYSRKSPKSTPKNVSVHTKYCELIRCFKPESKV